MSSYTNVYRLMRVHGRNIRWKIHADLPIIKVHYRSLFYKPKVLLLKVQMCLLKHILNFANFIVKETLMHVTDFNREVSLKIYILAN